MVYTDEEGRFVDLKRYGELHQNIERGIYGMHSGIKRTHQFAD